MNDDHARAQKLLKGAYALETSEDNSRYYRDFAPIYDEQFADALGYTYPAAVAEIFVSQHVAGVDLPLLDIGSGTGLVAQSVVGIGDVDGVDLSAEMLEVAKAKKLYRHLYRHDLTTGTGPLPCDYGGVVSAGTFTHGHLGPDALDSLLAVGRSGALYCIGINRKHFQSADFQSTFTKLLSAELITEYQEFDVDIFSESEDKAIVAAFRKTEALR